MAFFLNERERHAVLAFGDKICVVISPLNPVVIYSETL